MHVKEKIYKSRSLIVYVLFLSVVLILAQGGTTASVAQKTTLRFAWPTGGEIPTETIRKAIEEFEAKNVDVKVNLILQPKDTYEDIGLKTMIAGGDIPHIYYLNGGKWKVQQYVPEYAEDLTEYLYGDFGPLKPGDWGYTFDESMLDYDKINGRHYLIPYVQSTHPWFWFNKDMFEKYALTSPATWPEFVDICEKLKAQDILPVALANKEAWCVANTAAHLICRVVGEEAYDAVFSLKEGYKFTDPGIIEALDILGDLLEKGYINEDANGLTTDEGSMLLIMNKAAIHPIGSWFPVIAATSAPPTFHYDVFPLPSIPGGKGDPSTVLGGPNGWVVGKGAPVEAAVELLKFLTSPEMQKCWVKEVALFAVTKGSMASEIVPHPSLSKLAKWIGECKVALHVPDEGYGYDLAEYFEDAVTKVLDGVPAKVALEECEKGLEELEAR